MTKDEIIQLYVKKYGKKAQDMLNWLGREQKFIDAISTELGQEIMSIHLNRMISSFNRLMQLLLEVDDFSKVKGEAMVALAEYKVAYKMIWDVESKIRKYNEDKLH